MLINVSVNELSVFEEHLSVMTQSINSLSNVITSANALLSPILPSASIPVTVKEYSAPRVRSDTVMLVVLMVVRYVYDVFPSVMLVRVIM